MLLSLHHDTYLYEKYHLIKEYILLYLMPGNITGTLASY